MKKYRQWLLRYLLLSATVIFVYLGLVYEFFATPQYSLWINNCLMKKESYAASIKGPKIVFVSGSNTLFGVRAADVERYFGVPSVNLAVHYGLQIDYMLDRAKRVVEPGDVVVLPLEYSHYSYDGGYSIVKSFFIRTYDPQYFRSLPWKEKLRHLANTTPVDFVKALFDQARFDGQEGKSGDVYNSQTLNRNGDETYGDGPVLERLERAEPIRIPKEFLDSYGFRKVLEFNSWCRENSVLVFVSWPNTMYFDSYEDTEYVDYFDRLAGSIRAKGVKTLGSPRDFFYPIDYFYDGSYHLNQRGISVRTKSLISVLESDQMFQGWLHAD